MTTETPLHLTDDEIETELRRPHTSAIVPDTDDADGDDADGTDSDDADGNDGDATDMTDGDTGDDADGTDA